MSLDSTYSHVNYKLHALCFLANNQTPIRILELKTGKYSFGEDVHSIDNFYLRYKLAVMRQGSESSCFMCLFEFFFSDRLNFLDLETLLYSNQWFPDNSQYPKSLSTVETVHLQGK